MTPRRLFAVVGALAGLLLTASLSRALPPDNYASMALNPASGPAAAQLTATMTLQAGPNNPCTVNTYHVQFSWDGRAVGQQQPVTFANNACSAKLTFTPPPDLATAGQQHAVCGTTGPNDPAAPQNGPYRACANYTVTVPPAPTPSPHPTPTPTPATRPTPTPTSAPTPSPTPSPSPAPTTQPSPSPSNPPVTASSAGGPPSIQVGGRGVNDALLPWLLIAGVLVGLGFPAILIAWSLSPTPRLLSIFGIIGIVAVALAGGVDRSGLIPILPHPTLALDSARVTQGLDYDYMDSAATPFDMVAGKDTLGRAVLRITDLGSGSVSARCHTAVPTDDGSVAEVAADDPAAVKADITRTSGTLSTDPSTPVTATYQADCWIPGYSMVPAGNIDVVMTVRVSGLHPRTYLLATPNLKPTGDIRLLVYPQLWPVQDVGSSEAHPWSYCGTIATADLKEKCPKVVPTNVRQEWTSDISASAYNVLEQIDRVWPLRSGLTAFDRTGASPHTIGSGGLRYDFAPIYDACAPFAASPAWQGLRVMDCDLRGDAQAMVATRNASLAVADAADGRHRDRFDYSVVLQATAPGSTGGQCAGGSNGDQVEVDTNADGGGTYVAIQELTHCVGGMLTSTSPHSDSKNSTHSVNHTITTSSDAPAINMITHEEVGDPQSSMPAASGAAGHQMFLEGWDYNFFRNHLLTMKRADPDPGTYRLVKSVTPGPTLTVSLTLTGDTASLRWSAESSGISTGNPPSTPLAYALVLRDASGAELSRVPFDLDPPLHPNTVVSPVTLIAPLPAGATGFDVLHGATTILTRRFSGAPPVTDVTAAVSGADGVDVAWQGPDDGLYSVWYTDHPGADPIPVAFGLHGNHAHLGVGLTAPTSTAVFSVRATDGMHTNSASASPVVLPPHPPLVAITSPAQDSSLTDIAPITLHALAYDVGAGAIRDDAIRWTIDGAPRGSGATDVVHLAAGDHQVTVTATAGGHTSSASRILQVVRATLPALFRLPARGDVRDLGSCPGPATTTLDAGATKFNSSASWLQVSGVGGRPVLSVNCAAIPSGATLMASLASADAAGHVHITWVAVRGAGWHLPSGLLVVLATLAIAVVTATITTFLVRRTRCWPPGDRGTDFDQSRIK